MYGLRRLQRQKEKIKKRGAKRRKEAREQKKSEVELGSILNDEMMDLEFVDDDIADLQSRYLRRQAERYLVPEPKFDTESKDWVQSKISGGWRMAPHPLSELRTAVQREKRERREHWQSWVILLIGLGGVLIGVLSFLK